MSPAARLTVMVRPPPGVSAGLMVASMACGEAVGDGQAEPEATIGGVVALALERGEDVFAAGRRGCRVRGR